MGPSAPPPSVYSYNIPPGLDEKETNRDYTVSMWLFLEKQTKLLTYAIEDPYLAFILKFFHFLLFYIYKKRKAGSIMLIFTEFVQ